MLRRESCWIGVVLGVLITPAGVWAQSGSGGTSTSSPTSTAEAGSEPEQPAVIDDPQGSPEVHADYAAALDGSGLIDLEQETPSHLMVGATFATGWDSNPNNQPGSVSTALYTVSPYIGLRASSATARALLQYQFTNTSFGSAYARQSMHLGSVRLQRSRSDRWSWELDATGRYGQDSVRFLGSPQTVAVGEVPGSGPNVASYLPNAGTVTYLEGAFGTTYLKSQRDTIQIKVGDVFSRYQGFAGSSSIATTNLSYQHDVSPALGLFAYQESSFYYGTLNCQSFGGGIGVSWRPRERTTLVASGGPQLDTPSCGSQQGFAFNVALSGRLTGRSQIYLLAARQPTSSYLGPGLWQQSITAGYQHEVGTRGEVSVDAGYVASSTLARLSSYHGTYADAVYGHRLGRGMRASASYRVYRGDSGAQPFSRNVAQVSLAWTPRAGHLIQ